MRTAATTGIALGLVGALTISLTNVFSRAHFDAGSTPETFLVGRYLLYVMVLGLALALAGRLHLPTLPQARELLLAGVLNMGGASCLAFAIDRIEVGLAVVVLYLFPFFTLLIGAALERKAPRMATFAGLGVAFAGLVLALDVGGDPPDPAGVAFALAAAVLIAGSFVCIERRLGGLNDSMRLFGLGAVGLVCALVLGAASGNVVWPLPTPDGWSTLLLATLTFAIASSAMFMAVSRIGATGTALLMNLEPPATVVFAWWFLADRIGAAQLIGIVIVIAAVATTQWWTARYPLNARLAVA